MEHHKLRIAIDEQLFEVEGQLLTPFSARPWRLQDAGNQGISQLDAAKSGPRELGARGA
jgi:hypothetical protein